MSEHHASVVWSRSSEDFAYESYNRAHEMTFKAGAIRLTASAAPAFRGDEERVDPEEAYVASLASCHMLSFLAICARKRLTVDHYEDDAVGHLEIGPSGKLWIGRVVLSPKVQLGAGMALDETALTDIHHRAHEECFIANSVKTEVTVTPRL